MATVWVVEEGEYSDYHVVGVFSSREKAQALCDLENKGLSAECPSTAKIAEWPLDPWLDETNQGLVPHLVWMGLDGSSATAHDNVFRSQDFPAEYQSTFSVATDDGSKCYGYVWARDKKHAIKILNERRLQYLAGATT